MWEHRLKLGLGETLRQDRSYIKGTMQEEDVEEYSVLNAQNEVVGKVVYRDHVSIKGFRRTQSLEQIDTVNRKVVVNETW